MRVSTVHARALIEAFESYGKPSAELLAAANISPDAIAEGYAWLDVAELDTLTCAALTLTGDRAFGLELYAAAEQTSLCLTRMLRLLQIELRF